MEKNSAVLITGAIKNSGLSVAEKFLSSGRTVFITGRNGKLATKKAEELKTKYNSECFGLRFDPLQAKETCEDLFSIIADMGYIIDTLVCVHADPGFDQNTLTVRLDEWENVILTNVMGYYMPARCMAKVLADAKRTGSVVFISSTVAAEAIPGRSAYVASKGAETAMTKALALDLAGYGIRVNCVVPGPVHTDRWDVLADEDKQCREKIIPLGTATFPDQIAEAVWFLSSAAASGITGASLTVDGGLECVVPGAY